jgi:hypothetical protein
VVTAGGGLGYLKWASRVFTCIWGRFNHAIFSLFTNWLHWQVADLKVLERTIFFPAIAKGTKTFFTNEIKLV